MNETKAVSQRMMRKIRGVALVIAIAVLLSLVGCGAEDPYSVAMRAGEAQNSFGQGDKIAVYDTAKKQYV